MALANNPPRIPHLPREDWNDAARDVFGYWEGAQARENGSRSNTMMTLANHHRVSKGSGAERGMDPETSSA
jgi:4-carboxymuconolactone decarboxylase